MPAILFGSISTVADTSELQREAFNEAFRVHGLDWEWERDAYRALLEKSGGRQRIADHAASRGEEVDIDAVYATKSAVFQDNLRTARLDPRPGVAETVRDARSAGERVALVSLTSRENLDALFSALGDALKESDFDLVTDVTSVKDPKPAPDAYAFAMQRLGLTPSECVAVEDNVPGAQAAVAAGVACVAFPNANTAGHEFAGAARSVDRVEFAELRELVGT